jgi:hypothetical protein
MNKSAVNTLRFSEGGMHGSGGNACTGLTAMNPVTSAMKRIFLMIFLIWAIQFEPPRRVVGNSFKQHY